MSSKNKLENTCGTKINARCTKYELEIPTFSSLSGNDCNSLESTTRDLYLNLEEVIKEVDLTSLENTLEYNEAEEDTIKVNEFAVTLEREVTLLKEVVQNIPPETLLINPENIDTSCLVDQCEVGFTSAESILQALINKVCNLETLILNN